MRASDTYRGSRRNEARESGFFWGGLDMVALTTGERRIKYPFERGGKTAEPFGRPPPFPGPSNAARAEAGRYPGGELRRLRAERGVGPSLRILHDTWKTFQSTKRAR